MDIRFRTGDLTEALQAMAALEGRGDGWINLAPDAGDPAALGATRSVPGMLFGRLGGRGPAVPKVTWTAPRARRRAVEPSQIGIEHPAGPKAAAQLAAAGHAIPSSWVVSQDHPIRGLVITLPTGVGHEEVLCWALGAAEILSGAHLGDAWRARVFEPS